MNSAIEKIERKIDYQKEYLKCNIDRIDSEEINDIRMYILGLQKAIEIIKEEDFRYTTDYKVVLLDNKGE